MRTAPRSWLREATVAAALGALLLTGCGAADTAGGGGGSGAGAGGEASDDPRLPAMPEVTDGADVEAARADLLEYFEPAPFTPPGDAFDVASVAEPVWFITATSQFPVVPYVNAAFEAAAEQAGVEYRVCPGESTAEKNALCVQQAIDAGAGSLQFLSQDPATHAEPLREAREAGIAVVSGNNALQIGDPPDENTDASVSHDYYGAGVINGTYAVSRFGGATDALCLAIPEFKVTGSVCQGFTDAVTEYCRDWKVTT